MIIPHGLEKPRSQIEVSICIFSADILHIKKLSKFEAFTKNFGYFKRDYLLLNTDEKQLEDEQKDRDSKKLKGEEIDRKSAVESENYFVRITFAGIMVSK